MRSVFGRALRDTPRDGWQARSNAYIVREPANPNNPIGPRRKSSKMDVIKVVLPASFGATTAMTREAPRRNTRDASS